MLNPQDGTATLSPDGHTVTFLPAPGYTGPASFQFAADDGYGTSAPATVSVNVSTAPLVDLDFATRPIALDPGATLTEQAHRRFRRSEGRRAAALVRELPDHERHGGRGLARGPGLGPVGRYGGPARHQPRHPGGDGHHGRDPRPTWTSNCSRELGLTAYPPALSLEASVGTRQLTINVAGDTDLTAASTGTVYYVSNPTVVTVNPDGLVTAGAAGVATITVINGPAEKVIPVLVEAPEAGPAVLGPAGGVVRGPDGSLVMVDTGALAER